MFNKIFMQRMVESAISFYLPFAEGLKNNRIDELQYIKSRIKENPLEVEEWFDKEINRIENFRFNNISNELKGFENKS
jgi:hypothetical protein